MHLYVVLDHGDEDYIVAESMAKAIDAWMGHVRSAYNHTDPPQQISLVAEDVIFQDLGST